MSWKSVEMQVALPRTQDAGRIQDQMQQRGRIDQESLASNQLVKEEMKRKQVNDYNQKNNVNNKKQEPNNQAWMNKRSKNEMENDALVVSTDHPYLGKQIDFNG
ncbi:hypothetical protein [Aquibacillus rhizosphaerae]|uniref:Uncharacterized protein n=1 Tax=Aquibacillus rhizosphaerae TaxID=3051431 RepID=A0ABT7L2K2_9BACI|nr:hypothetical protein [Aquibacillus sp. LR5S19]MDL4840089.1 hypothetical protein [Aquibacillus sp. LR5S19]